MNREKKNKQKQVIKAAKSRFDEYLKDMGLMLDDGYIKNLSTTMRYGYRDKFDVKLAIDGSDLFCTAITNQDFLKEPLDVLISRYSRMTELSFTCIGIITQVGNAKANLPQPADNEMKNATQKLADQIANLEERFNGRCSNEIVVDPIAIFTVL